MNGITKVIEMLGDTISVLEQQLAAKDAQIAELSAAIVAHPPDPQGAPDGLPRN